MGSEMCIRDRCLADRKVQDLRQLSAGVKPHEDALCECNWRCAKKGGLCTAHAGIIPDDRWTIVGEIVSRAEYSGTRGKSYWTLEVEEMDQC